MVNKLFAKKFPSGVALSEQPGGRVERFRERRRIRPVGAARKRWRRREPILNSVKPRGQASRNGNIWVDVGAGQPILDPDGFGRRPGHRAQRRRAIVNAPGRIRRRPNARDQALIGIHRRTSERGEFRQ